MSAVAEVIVAGLAVGYLLGALVDGDGWVLVARAVVAAWRAAWRVAVKFRYRFPAAPDMGGIETTFDLSVRLRLTGWNLAAKYVLCRWCTALPLAFLVALPVVSGGWWFRVLQCLAAACVAVRASGLSGKNRPVISSEYLEKVKCRDATTGTVEKQAPGPCAGTGADEGA